MVEKNIKITLIGSLIHSKPNQRKTARALGLGKISSSVIQKSTAPILGMINTIVHLVKVEDVK